MTTPATFTFEGVSVEFSALELGLGGLTELAQADATTVEVAETAQGLLTFISTSRANFHNSSDLQQELLRLAQDPKIASVLMQALHLIHQGNWHPTTKRFGPPDLSFLAKRNGSAQLSAEAGRAETKPRVSVAPTKTGEPDTKVLVVSPPSAHASLWGRVTNAWRHFVETIPPLYEVIPPQERVIATPINPTIPAEKNTGVTVPSFEDRVQGSIVGGAIGDALGHPTEFLKLEQIRQRYGPQGVRDFALVRDAFGEPRFLPGTYTDDTQMTLAVANALLDTRAGYQGDLVGAFSHRFIEWLDSPDNNRAPGNACLNGCENLKHGVPWYRSGTENSKGCGAAMRVAPIGIVYHQQPAKLDEVARFSAILTHWHPTAYAAAIVGARLVAHALHATSPEDFKQTALDTVLTRVPASGQEAINALEKIPQAMTLPPDEAFALLGEGWVAEEAVAGALYAVLSTPNFEEAVLRAANTNGDSDSLAAIAGGIAGALYGIHAIPEKWVREVENGERLLALGDDLATLAEEVSKKDPSERVLRMHDPDLIKFPEIQRYSRDPQAAVDLFVLMFADRSRAMTPLFNKDVWMDTRAPSDDQVRISRRYRDRLIQSGQRHEAEIVPLDTFVNFLISHQNLLLEKRMNIYLRMVLGIITGPAMAPSVQGDYFTEWTKWMLAHSLGEIHPGQIPEAALRDLETRLRKKYPEWRQHLKTQEWAVEYIKKHLPGGWTNSFGAMLGFEKGTYPEAWDKDYEDQANGFENKYARYIRRLSWAAPLVEWYFVEHALFVQQHLDEKK